VSTASATQNRPLGAPTAPRRPFAPPAAVRLAQFCLVARVSFVVGALFTTHLSASPTNLTIPGVGHLVLPDGTIWSALVPWIFVAALVEIGLVMRLGTLRTGSRRVVLLVESLVIVISGLYTAAGIEPALVPLVMAIGAVVLLRLDHVRHSFDRARAQRRMVWQKIPAVLYEGYALPDPVAIKEVQRIGYRVGLDGERLEKSAEERSRA
jgi:hypothetical protein